MEVEIAPTNSMLIQPVVDICASECQVACGPSTTNASTSSGSGGTRHSHANRSNIGTSLACRSRRLPIAKLTGAIISTAKARTLKSNPTVPPIINRPTAATTIPATCMAVGISRNANTANATVNSAWLCTITLASPIGTPCAIAQDCARNWPRNSVPLIAISGTLFLGQFLAQSWAIAHGVPIGLASVIVQSQALFTVAFAVIAFREIPTAMQVAGIAVAAIGLLMIGGTVGFDFSVLAFAVLMIAPVSFAIGNLLLRQARDVPMFDLFAWLCLVPPLPLLALAFAVDGPGATWLSLWQMSATGWISMIFVGAISTCIAYWLWGRLLRDHTAAQVVPFALLVPFVGAAASSVVFGETFGPLRLAGMLTVVGGIAIMLLSKRPQALPEIV